MIRETQPFGCIEYKTICLEKNKNINNSTLSTSADSSASLNPPSTPLCFRESSNKDFSDIVPPAKENCISCKYVNICKTRLDELEFLEKNISTIIQYEVYKSIKTEELTESDHY